MTVLTGCTIGGTAIPNASNAFTLEMLLGWSCEAYYKLFTNVSYQSEQFIERLTFAQKTLYKRTDLNQDVLVYTVHLPMQSSSIQGQVDWQNSSTFAGRWNYAVQPTSDAALAVPVSLQTLR